MHNLEINGEARRAEPRNARSRGTAVGVAVLSMLMLMSVAGCSFRPSQGIKVSMSEGPWSVDPAIFADTERFEFTFTNEGSESHQPIVVAASATTAELEEHFAENGVESLVAKLVNPELAGVRAALIYPDGESGKVGHFHPGGADEIDLPSDALVYADDEDETIRYLFTEGVPAGEVLTQVVTAGKRGITFGYYHPGTTFVVFCLNPDHADLGEYAILEMSP